MSDFKEPPNYQLCLRDQIFCTALNGCLAGRREGGLMHYVKEAWAITDEALRQRGETK